MNDVIEVALAAVMHDWGKLFQRAEQPLSDQARRMEQMICPTNRAGFATHKHVLWTNEALEHYTPWLPPELDRARIVRLAGQHHRPGEADEWIIAEADRLASGHDRRETSEEERADFRSVPLRSTIGGLRIREGRKGSAGIYFPQALQADDSLFPQAAGPDRSLIPEYRRVAEAMADCLGAWPGLPVSRVCDAVGGASERFLTAITASTIDVPDVSLHDHARLVAAMAAALYVFHRDTQTTEETPVRDRRIDKFLLLSGDLSGIQSYLFDLPTEGAKGIARTYRARSFYLAMLTHAASLWLLEAIGLPGFNRVLDAGGRFTLLLPNTPQAKAAVDRVREEIDAWMLREHGGGLTLNLSAPTVASGAHFMGAEFLALYREFLNGAEIAKKRKLAAWLQQDGRWDMERQRLEYVHTRDRQRAQFELHRNLGRWLPEAEYAGLWRAEAPSGLMDDSLRVFDYRLQLFDSEPDTRAWAEAADAFRLKLTGDQDSWLPRRPMALHIPRLSEEDVGRLRFDNAGDDEDRPSVGGLATFEHLALLARRPSSRDSQTRHGLAAIACLKADVDRLGYLFTHGFEGDASFGRVATLSRQLDLFFKAFLSHKQSDAGSLYRHVYTVFAGGDDLMLVGPWPTILNLALDLRGWFARLTLDNPDVTLSAGIALGHARLPISVMAAQAEQQLEEAKLRGRNRIGIIGEVFTWNEYQRALDDGRRLDELVQLGDNRSRLSLTPGFVYRLLQYERMAAKVDDVRRSEELSARGKPVSPRSIRLQELKQEYTWRSHARYDLARNIRERIKRDAAPEVHRDLEWLEGLFARETSTRQSRRLKLSATYALYRNRGG